MQTEDEMEEEEEYEPDDAPVYFTGDCTCIHTPGGHGWGRCDMWGCDCEAGWEE